jgi:hypothetical protein
VTRSPDDCVGAPHESQRVTAKDIEAGQVRMPSSTKTILPASRRDLAVVLRGLSLRCRWDPRDGPPVRSGVLRVGKDAATELLLPGDVLRVTSEPSGLVRLV